MKVSEKDKAKKIVIALNTLESIDQQKYTRILSKLPKDDGRYFKKNELLVVYKDMCETGNVQQSKKLDMALQTKPIRTISGVVPVTVLTKPYPCPGKCIFCPTDYRMPKSYLHDEPGAMRAEANKFDPFLQTQNRIKAFEVNGHNTDKIELLILGGTWSAYEQDYQEWFIKRCFDAMNGNESKNLRDAQKKNEIAKHRNVGLVIETRPDHVNEKEILRLRRLGVTKVQIGIQSLRNKILAMNNRGETIEDIHKAIELLRMSGIKIHVHWMPNLLGATLDSDRIDYKKIWADIAVRPDEIKIYPCSILKNAELYEYYKRGEFIPYSEEELVDLLVAMKPLTPRYARISRMIRDIPSGNIVSGNKKTNLRQIVKRNMKKQDVACSCIRCREVRDAEYKRDSIDMIKKVYKTSIGKDVFISFEDLKEQMLIGFLRLTMIDKKRSNDHFINELQNCAIIREVHIYGKSLNVKEKGTTNAQHVGYGKQLVREAEEITKKNGINKIVVISAIGTRKYYEKLGYTLGELYMSKNL